MSQNQSTYNIISSTDEMTVVSEYTPSPSTSESYQSEADLEREFIALLTRQGYEYLQIHEEKDLIFPSDGYRTFLRRCKEAYAFACGCESEQLEEHYVTHTLRVLV